MCSFALFVLLHAAWLGAASAAGIDCSKASSQLEKVLCSDTQLLALDREMAKLFAVLQGARSEKGQLAFRELSVAEKLILAREQRQWIGTRNATCGASGNTEMSNCLATQLEDRLSAIRHDWGVNSTGEFQIDDRPLVYDVIKDTGETNILFQGQTLYSFETQGPLEVLRRLERSDFSAALLEIGGGYNGKCGEIVVAVASKGQAPHFEKLDDFCLSYTSQVPMSAERTDDGFKTETPSRPFAMGSQHLWVFGHEVQTFEIPFKTESKSRMENFYAPENMNLSEPARNEEFFNGIKKRVSKDFDRVITAVWQPIGGCLGCGRDKTELYGARVQNDLIIFSGCGYADGMVCGDDDALVVWDRKSRAFHVALDAHRGDGVHVERDVQFFPSQQKWSGGAMGVMSDWMKGTSLLSARR